MHRHHHIAACWTGTYEKRVCGQSDDLCGDDTKAPVVIHEGPGHIRTRSVIEEQADRATAERFGWNRW